MKEDADFYKDRAEAAIQLLRDFVDRRSKEHWS